MFHFQFPDDGTRTCTEILKNTNFNYYETSRQFIPN